MKTTSNTQTFQTLYVDESATPENKIVLIEETYEGLPEAQGVLVSFEKENKYGMVISGSSIAIANFRAKLYDYDRENNLGRKELVDILTKVVDVAFSCKCDVAFYKGPSLYKNIPEDMKKVVHSLDFTKMSIGAPEWFDKLKDSVKLSDKDQKQIKDDLEKAYKTKNLNEVEKFLKDNEEAHLELEQLLKKDNTKQAKDLLNVLKNLDVDEVDDYAGVDYTGIAYIVKTTVNQNVDGIIDMITMSYATSDEEHYGTLDVPTLEEFKRQNLETIEMSDEEIDKLYKEEEDSVNKENVKNKQRNEELKQKIRKNIVDNIVNIGFAKEGEKINHKEFVIISKKPMLVKKEYYNWPKPSKLKLEDIKKYDFSEFEKIK